MRFSAHRGVTLVELMISMLILTLVCVAWLEIIGIQSARKEARRREAVERLAGMMDAFLYVYKEGYDSECFLEPGYYYSEHGTELSIMTGGSLFVPHNDDVNYVFNSDVSPVGYQLCVAGKDEMKKLCGWRNDDLMTWGVCHWLVGMLWDRSGKLVDVKAHVKKPFFTLPVCLGFNVDLL